MLYPDDQSLDLRIYEIFTPTDGLLSNQTNKTKPVYHPSYSPSCLVKRYMMIEYTSTQLFLVPLMAEAFLVSMIYTDF